MLIFCFALMPERSNTELLGGGGEIIEELKKALVCLVVV